MSTGYIGTQEISTFPHDCFQDILLPGHSSLKRCGFLSVWRFLLSFVMDSFVYRILPAVHNNLIFKDCEA